MTRLRETRTHTTPRGTRLMEHSTEIHRPAEEIYQLLAMAEDWPRVFPPTIFLRQEAVDETSELVHIWATANGEVRNWTSRRDLDPSNRVIQFRQERFQPPVGFMVGTWIVEPSSSGSGCVVKLQHEFRASDSDPQNLEWLSSAVDTNSCRELEALRAYAELYGNDTGLLLEFEDEVTINAAPEVAFEFINEADHWSSRLEHVAEARLEEPAPGVQILAMDTIAKDGSTHTTKSYRICFPSRLIAYKQTTLPPLMNVHNGEWHFESDEVYGSRVISKHAVRLNPDKITTILGPDADIETARNYIRDALGTNSLKTLNQVKYWAERTSG